MSKDALYTQVVKLPTKGLLNPDIPNGDVTQRLMKVADKKYLAGTKSNSDSVVEGLVKRCTVAPEKFDVSNLINADLMFLLFKLRILSYGEDYKFRARCPECSGRIDVNVKLSELELHELPEDFQSQLIVTLPHNGAVVHTKFLTVKDQSDITKEVKRMKRKFSEMQDDPGVTLRIAKMITKVELTEANGAGDSELTDPVDILKFVEDLTDLDSLAIESTVENIKVGVDPTVEHECPECSELIDIDVAFSSEFFRPKYETKSR